MVGLAVPVLTDGHVVLRAHLAEDAQRVLEQSRDPTSQRWTTVPVPYSLADAHRFVGEVMPAGWAANSEWGFAVEVGGEYGGTVSLRNEGLGRAEIAYGAHPAIRGTGAVERALRLLLAWGFEDMDLETVIWWADRGNWASRKVAWRLGFSLAGIVPRWQPQRGVLRDAWVGSLHRDQPRSPATTWLDCPVLEGEGVRLRPFAASDVPRIVEGCSDPVTQQWLGHLPTPYTEDDAHAYLERSTEQLATATGVAWAVVDPAAPDLLLGDVGVFSLVPDRECEVGYWTHPAARGRGLTARAATLAVAHAFEALGVHRVTAFAAVPNTASRRVLERLGFTQTGVSRDARVMGDGSVVDRACYDLLAEEWRSPRE